MSGEVWERVTSDPDYEVSDRGRIRSWKVYRFRPGPRILNPPLGHGGYPTAWLARGARGQGVKRMMHVLVAEAFLGKRPPGAVIRHLDGNPLNNTVANLAYGTNSENQRDAVQHGTNYWMQLTQCPQGHPYDEENTMIGVRGDGRKRRRCRECVRLSNQRARARRSQARVEA